MCKVAEGKPLHKKRWKFELKNYRPVSLLQILSKIIESHI